MPPVCNRWYGDIIGMKPAAPNTKTLLLTYNRGGLSGTEVADQLLSKIKTLG